MIGGDAVADDQVVEADPYAIAADDLARLVVDAHHFGSPEADTLVLRGEVAQRVRDVAGVEAARRDLVQQRLEGVVRVAVDQGHPEPFLGQLVGR